MQFSTLFTALVGAAVFRGTGAAPVATPQTDVFPLTDICNGGQSWPDEVLTPLSRNYAACHRRMEENPRLFGGISPVGRQALCVAEAGFKAGLRRALDEKSSEIPVRREGLHRLAASYAVNPMPSPRTAGHSLDELRKINFDDYRLSASTQYNSQLEEQVAMLPASQHLSSPQDDQPTPWQNHEPKWVRSEIAERNALVTLREVGKPESLSHAQADALRAQVEKMRFGHTKMKRRMLKDARRELVNKLRMATEQTPTDQRPTSQRSVATG